MRPLPFRLIIGAMLVYVLIELRVDSSWLRDPRPALDSLAYYSKQFAHAIYETMTGASADVQRMGKAGL